MKNYKGNTLIQWMVILGDFALLNSVLLFYIVCFPSLIPPVLDVKTRIFAFICNVSMAVAQYFFPSYIHRRRINFESIVGQVFRLVLTQTLVAFVCIRILYNNGGMFRFMLIYAPSLLLVLILARIFERIVLGWYRLRGGNTRTAIFVGSDPANKLIYQEMTEDASTGYHVLGYFSNDVIPDESGRLRKLGSLESLMNSVRSTADLQTIYPEGAIDELFCCLSHDETDKIVDIMRYCDRHLIRFYYVPRMIGNINLSLKSERVGSFDLFTNHREPLQEPVNRLVKRLFDIMVSFIVCLLMLPFIPLIALIIKYQSKGPILFTQNRTGLNGKTFLCYKFRSMHVNEHADMDQATLDDPRKFPFGSFMRKYNIDEFPQFFNVLRGDMSIVGPRPHMLLHTETYSQLIEKYMVRHFSKPGITGWAQVTGFRGETKHLWEMEERIRRDIWYIENWSFWLDIRIILMTASTLFKRDKMAY